MRLIALKLKNFKGLEEFIFNPNGQNAAIYGDNACGKTTIFDAFNYLLFDKDSQNRSAFDLKTLDENNDPIHHLEHEVEGIFDIGGKKVVFRKVYTEKWTKKHGTQEKVLTGHNTDHYINEVPASKGEYKAKIDSIADESIFKLLTSPSFFNEQLHWRERRDTLMKVCGGDITDADVIASDDKLAALPDILGERTILEHESMVKDKSSKLEKQKKDIPVQIKEALRHIPDITGIDAEKIPHQIADIRSAIEEKQAEIARIKSGGQVAEKTKLLREVEGKVLDIKNKYRETVDVLLQGKRGDLARLQLRAGELQQSINSNNRSFVSNTNFITDKESRMGKLREDWVAENAREFTFVQDDTCPACGQALPEERLAEARAKAEENFNLERAKKLEGISADGKRYKAEKEKLQAENDTLKQQTDNLDKEAKLVGEDIAAMQAEIDSIANSITDITQLPDYIQVMKEKETLEGQIAELKSGNSEQVDAIKKEVLELDGKIYALEYQLSQVKTHNQGQVRVKELKAQEKELAKQMEGFEGQLYLIKQFTRAKCSLLEDKINNRFRWARFKLFDVLVNGEIEETCTTLYKGVPYGSGLNSGHKIIVGLDIIRTLSEYHSFCPPIFCDNAESVTRLPEMDTQIIRLVVSEEDKTLRVVA